MPFCTQCGKKLEDGEVCSCQTEIKEAAGQEEENPVHDEEQALQTEETAGQSQPEIGRASCRERVLWHV